MTWEMVVGLEVHVQLKTVTKAFCACSANFGDPPNTNVCPVCLGLPGALPVVNARAILLATQAALAFGCTVHQRSVFARKHYFYPDLPKGYQISQYDEPLATDGRLELGADASRVIRITRVHVEEDAGKSLHDRFSGATAIDLNRAGIPLIEIVSEPDIRSAAEAGAYLRTMKQILAYMDVSDVSMEEGSLRVDANISTRRRGTTTLGRKTEVKNLNTFSGVERALDVEFARQCAILERGEQVEQQTMLWDADLDQVRPARLKEGSDDYRYFPDPDLPPLVLDTAWIDDARARLPELPSGRRERFRRDYAISAYDADVLTASSALAEYFEAIARTHGDAKAAANWVMGEVLAALKNAHLGSHEIPVPAANVAALLGLVRDGRVGHTAAKRIFATMMQEGGSPLDIATRDGLLLVTDDASLRRWVDEVIVEHPREVERFAAGETKLQGVLIGAAMKKSNGSADPKRLAQLFAERLRRGGGGT
jgi:aspartyl-tRNA(Asn)/glutamyl-tRNA(Gln) amidotransferase subunit B